MKKFFLWMMASVFVFSGLGLAACSNDNIDNDSGSGPAVPEPTAQKAKWTVIVYGQTGAQMDALMEGVYERCKPLMASSDVRLFFCYQYGKDEVKHGEHTFKAKYAKEGDVLFFELTKDTDLSKLTAKSGSEWKITDPANLTAVINDVAKAAPAENYSLVIYGHGGGFDIEVDCPDNYRKSSTRATLYDAWDQTKGGTGAISMYNLANAINNSTVKHFNTLFFHSCLMGNIECLSNVYTCADYIVSSAHVLAGVDCIMAEYIKALYQQNDAEKTVAQMFEGCYNEWQAAHLLDPSMNLGMNGDMNLIKSAELPQVMAVMGKLRARILALYPTQKEAIHLASDKVYTYVIQKRTSQMDIQNYADLLAVNTGDDQMKAIAAELKQALDNALLKRMMVNYDAFLKLPQYGLSVALVKNTTYAKRYGDYTFQQAYEASEFHKQSGWGEWLKVNTRDVSRSMDGHGNIIIRDDDKE